VVASPSVVTNVRWLTQQGKERDQHY